MIYAMFFYTINPTQQPTMSNALDKTRLTTKGTIFWNNRLISITPHYQRFLQNFYLILPQKPNNISSLHTKSIKPQCSYELLTISLKIHHITVAPFVFFLFKYFYTEHWNSAPILARFHKGSILNIAKNSKYSTRVLSSTVRFLVSLRICICSSSTNNFVLNSVVVLDN